MSERLRRPGKGESPEHLTVRETDARYPGQWILMKITAFDELRTPIAGEIVTHGTMRHVNKTLQAIAAVGQWPTTPYYLFCAGAFIRSVADFTEDVEPVLPLGGARARSGR